MKKILLIVAALLVLQISDARPISEGQARRNAVDFLAKVAPRTKAAQPEELKLVWSLPEVATKAADDPLLYVFERPSGGFVIASGDDAARRVLAYSLDSRFPTAEEMPCNLKEWLLWYADVIDNARQKGLSSTATKADSDTGTDKPVVLETAKWNQWAPFNDLVPEISGQKPPIGCVATATAIIMQYYKWPEKGTGTIPGYDFANGAGHVDPIELGHTYDWSKMPSKASGFTRPEQQQIARLLFDVATMYEMQYALEGSGAAIYWANRLTEYFGYDKGMYIYYRNDGHSTSFWEQKMKDEIDAGRPALYAGYDTEGGGHAFVLDGYNGRYFSFNYGWGQGSAFFTVSPIDGNTDDRTEFFLDQHLVTGLMPDQGGTPQVEYVIYEGGATVPFDLAPNKPFTLMEGWFTGGLYVTSGGNEVTTTVCYALYDSKGNLKEQICPEETMTIKDGQWTIFEPECTINGKLADGDMIALSVKDAKTGQWAPMSENPGNSIVFTKAPLTEILNIAYVKNAPDDVKALNGEDLILLFNQLKDIPWVLYEEGADEPVMRRSLWGDTVEEYSRHVIIDTDEGLCSSYIWLPAGKYYVIFRNPLTNEELRVNLEL